MIKRFLLLIVIFNSVHEGLFQYVLCPYENGLYYATSPECLVYYRCENRMLWSGVCFPWQRFDMHSMSCRYLENVDCDPEYAGIWRQLYREIDQMNQVVEEIDNVETEGIGGPTKDEISNLDIEANGEIEIGTPEENIKGGNQDVVQVEAVRPDDTTMHIDIRNNNINKVNKIETHQELFSEEIKSIKNQDENKNVENKNENENVKSEQRKLTENSQIEQESQNINKIEDHLEGNKMKRNVDFSGKLTKVRKTDPISRESIIPDLMGPIITSVFIEDSTPTYEGITNNYDEETQYQSTTNAASEQIFTESSTSVVGTMPEDSSGRYWYWCGSGRFVVTQTQEDPNTICLQLEDPQFIDQEGPSTGTQDWGGHTFLGSSPSVS